MASVMSQLKILAETTPREELERSIDAFLFTIEEVYGLPLYAAYFRSMYPNEGQLQHFESTIKLFYFSFDIQISGFTEQNSGRAATVIHLIPQPTTKQNTTTGISRSGTAENTKRMERFVTLQTSSTFCTRRVMKCGGNTLHTRTYGTKS